MQKGFRFDLNKCTGCGACQIACSLENEVSLPGRWRQVATFNNAQVPDLLFHHISIACNHCIEAPCLKYCPALAISRKVDTGAVLIDDNMCIGCGYCSWVCPYDAPELNPSSGVMEKCTLCQHRLEEDLQPACVTLCPTGALQIENFEYKDQALNVNGFTQTDIKPAIRFVDLNQRESQHAESELPFEKEIIEKYLNDNTSGKAKSKINLSGEWPLAIFTLLAPILAGLFAGRLLSMDAKYDLLLILLGAAGIIISSIHLGKKTRAIRAIVNWRNSWISREIITYTLFLFLMTIYFFVIPDSSLPGWLAFGFLFISLYSMDQVYHVLTLLEPKKYHSSQAFLSGLLWTCLFTYFTPGFILFGIIKLVLYLQRKISKFGREELFITLRSATRILFGFIIPGLIMFLKAEIDIILMMPFLLAGEIIDRCEFYSEMEIITPQRQMEIDLDQAIRESIRK